MFENTFFEEVFKRLSMLGKVPVCNLKPERAPRYGGFCFPLCWRCTGIVLGMFVPDGLPFVKIPGDRFILLASGVLLVIPALYDGIRQYVFKVESNNRRRFITGFFAGTGMNMLITVVTCIVG